MRIENGQFVFTEAEAAYLEAERERVKNLPMWYVHPSHRYSIRELAEAEVARRNREERKVPTNWTYWLIVCDTVHYPGEFILTTDRYAM